LGDEKVVKRRNADSAVSAVSAVSADSADSAAAPEPKPVEFVNYQGTRVELLEMHLKQEKTGISYSGPTLNEKPHGNLGHAVYANQEEYHGGFFNGQKAGYGYMVDTDGEMYNRGIYFEDEIQVFQDHPNFAAACKLFRGWILDYNKAYMSIWVKENVEGKDELSDTPLVKKTIREESLTHSAAMMHTPSPGVSENSFSNTSFDAQRKDVVCYLLFKHAKRIELLMQIAFSYNAKRINSLMHFALQFNVFCIFNFCIVIKIRGNYLFGKQVVEKLWYPRL